MVVKKCFIQTCKSCSARKEDCGVTYHKFPKDITLHNTWIDVTHCKTPESCSYVCSRHFCKSDFQILKDSKYVLKSDAVPSIFPWSISRFVETKGQSSTITTQRTMQNMSDDNHENEKNISKNPSKDVEENVDAIKKFIENQTNEIKVQNTNTHIKSIDCNHDGSIINSNVMDVVLNETEEKLTQKKNVDGVTQQSLKTVDKLNSSIPLSVGSKVEAKDFSEEWHTAEIVEVDYDEVEVLVQYEQNTKKPSEWISVNSPRLRPIGSAPAKIVPITNEITSEPFKDEVKDVKEKAEEKNIVSFEVGERCLARWTDNKRFMATVHTDLGSGIYEVMFDDGVYWKCNKSRLYKWKPEKNDTLTVDTCLISPTTSTPSPIQSGSPSAPITPLPFHKHLFDPTRDYLGSKSERREMKRKLNIKEIFNIGQKRSKIQKVDTPKAVVEKKPSVVKKRQKTKMKTVVRDEVKTEHKVIIPDAVASIIGTVNKQRPTNLEVPKEKLRAIKTSVNESVDETKADKSKNDLTDTDRTTISEDIKLELENVLEEEVKLEKFEKQDDVKHEEVIDRMKEVINKLEGDLKNGIVCSPKPKVNEEPTMSTKVEISEIGIPKVQILQIVIPKVKRPEVDGPKVKIPEVVSPKVIIPHVISPKVETPQVDEVKENVINEIKVEIIPENDFIVTDEKVEIKQEENNEQESKQIVEPIGIDKQQKLSKIKKGKKLRLMREKKVKRQVEKVKNELEEMKKQVDEMRKQMLMKTQELAKGPAEMPESFLLPGEWCCKWVNGQPLGTVSEVVCEVKSTSDGKTPLPRRSVQVEDKRLPPGWTKHMVRRSLGHSAGKWDVVLVSPDNRRFHTKNDMRVFLENNTDKTFLPYEYALMDFGVHMKLSRRMGWISKTTGEPAEETSPPIGILNSSSPIVKKKKRYINKQKNIERKKKLMVKIKRHRPSHAYVRKREEVRPSTSKQYEPIISETPEEKLLPALEDGYVYVGSLKVQVIENLLRCPAEGCFKNFRNNTLLQMHIKHYHRELRKLLGSTPKVLDLAYARTVPIKSETPRQDSKTLRIKRMSKQPKLDSKVNPDHFDIRPNTPVDHETDKVPRMQDSPKLRDALINKPVKRPKVLLPVRRPEFDPPPSVPEHFEEVKSEETEAMDVPEMEQLDFETAICTHTVTKPIIDKKKKQRKPYSTALQIGMRQSEEEEWFAVNSGYESCSTSCPRSETPDSKNLDRQPPQMHYTLQEMPVHPKQRENAPSYMYTESGEKIKLVRMKREEIINCLCGFREEDGLMVQCELCLCWQHALCHNIQDETQVPEKYTCSICLNPRRGRRSKRFLHDQDRLYDGALPGAKPCDSLRRSHELSGNLLLIRDALHALRVKGYVAVKKNHPKLYLWAQDWEQAEITSTQERLNSGYSDLTIMPNHINRDNQTINHELIRDVPPLHIDTPSSVEHDLERYSDRDDSQSMLNVLMSGSGEAALDFPITTSELEQLASTVQAAEESGLVAMSAPQPEPPIENSVCRVQLLSHIQRCQALIDARLDSIEAQVVELESQDPTVEGDDTADSFPRTKQTVKMLMRDLDALEELGLIT